LAGINFTVFNFIKISFLITRRTYFYMTITVFKNFIKTSIIVGIKFVKIFYCKFFFLHFYFLLKYYFKIIITDYILDVKG
jgi:hypothetical protein